MNSKGIANKKACLKNLNRLLLTLILYTFYTTPCASIASATFTKPAIFAPFT